MVEILIIDDDPQMRRLLARMLSTAGHTVVQAENGKRGLELFHSLRPALIITDILMPERDGIETIRSIRYQVPETKILAISGAASGMNSPDYLFFAQQFGADASLTKPFTPAQLLEVVNRLLG